MIYHENTNHSSKNRDQLSISEINYSNCLLLNQGILWKLYYHPSIKNDPEIIITFPIFEYFILAYTEIIQDQFLMDFMKMVNIYYSFLNQIELELENAGYFFDIPNLDKQLDDNNFPILNIFIPTFSNKETMRMVQRIKEILVKIEFQLIDQF